MSPAAWCYGAAQLSWLPYWPGATTGENNQPGGPVGVTGQETGCIKCLGETMKQMQNAMLAVAGVMVSTGALAVGDPVPVDEPGMLTLLLGGGVITAVLLWRNRRKK